MPLVFTVLLVCASAWQSAEPGPLPLVAESNPLYSLRNGIIDMVGSRGWLRTRHLFLNFRATFDFKADAADADPGVIVRTWVGDNQWPGKGYRVRLPTSSLVDPSSVLVGHRQRVSVIETGRIRLRPPGEWQHAEIVAEGSRITFFVNSTLVGAYEIDSYGGHVLIDNRKGHVQFQNLAVVSTERQGDMPGNLLTSDQLRKAGGLLPKLIREVKPSYTRETVERGLEGRVELQLVVQPDGSPGEIRITKSLDPDLDLSAIAAVRGWRFDPAQLDGKPVSMLVEVDLTFTLR